MSVPRAKPPGVLERIPKEEAEKLKKDVDTVKTLLAAIISGVPKESDADS